MNSIGTSSTPSAMAKVQPAGNCPHCGMPLAAKSRGRCPDCRGPLDLDAAKLLPSLGPEWVRAIAWGALLMAAAVPLHAAGIYLVVRQDARVIGGGLHVLGAGAFCLGVWLLTARDDAATSWDAALAILSRVLSSLAVILWIGVMFRWSRQAAAAPILAPALLLMAAESVSFGLFASHLAARLPHQGLANQFRNFAYVMPVFFGVLFYCTLADLSAYEGLFFITYPALGALGGLMIWFAVTLVRLFFHLRRAARASDELILQLAKAVH